MSWDEVDDYYTGLLLDEDPALDAALEANAEAGLPSIDVSPAQGKMLHLLARAIGARRILEVGTLGGYSTIWLARAVQPEGSVVTCEIDPHHAQVATANIARAGLADTVDVRVGPAIDTLAGLTGPFDLAFIDADKASNAEYFAHALRLSRPGGVIVVDNVVRGGRVVDGASTDAAVVGTRRFAQALAAEERVDATVIQTVGSKGHDGFALAVVR
ncbi:O-methyltransferase [Pseudonocardia abyssalis]|uniref:O-methyltransferase n=1 Tax=Pseudonocardia abyssalis TaxID=2792008 RepID=A0ABS6USI2_9PSEU|nr:O-methyltransferase [Pseudonocardia abyssalis]MBW0117009.1 O-methyltransferase [Pseudonocardia abyssalis]MBW0135200.1 O-methyltransferase [Pseudonocardia abyssalis]